MNRKLLLILALIVIVSIVAYRYIGGEFDWRLFFSSFRDVQIGWLAASIVATFGTYLIRAIRWQVLLEPLKAIDIRTLMTATLVGFAAIYVIGRAGELVRPVWLAQRERIPISASAAPLIRELG